MTKFEPSEDIFRASVLTW